MTLLQWTLTARPQLQLCSAAWQALHSLHPLQLIARQARQAYKGSRPQAWLLAVEASGSLGRLTDFFRSSKPHSAHSTRGLHT